MLVCALRRRFSLALLLRGSSDGRNELDANFIAAVWRTQALRAELKGLLAFLVSYRR